MAQSLGQEFQEVLVVAHNENLAPITQAMLNEGFDVKVIRRDYSSQEEQLPRAIKCLLNHSTAWNYISNSRKPAIVVEADFVPCKGISTFPVPYDSAEIGPKMSFLYAAGPVIYHYDLKGYFFGHACTAVAYTLNPEAADIWIDLLEEHRKNRNFSKYYQWDVEMPVDLRRTRGVRLYISPKDYGEHGGIPNPEHKNNGITTWHHAAALMAPLAFMPMYARNSLLRYIFYRSRSRLRYVYKLVSGKYFDGWQNFWALKPNRLKKLIFALHRTFV